LILISFEVFAAGRLATTLLAINEQNSSETEIAAVADLMVNRLRHVPRAEAITSAALGVIALILWL
ncbi:MAG: hypothetical protein ACR2MP_02785, partial [Streptosporangiaceae bacterium]